MRKIYALLVIFTVITAVGVADTIYLRDGSVLNGTLIGWEDGAFILETVRGGHESYPTRFVSRVVVDRPDDTGDSLSGRIQSSRRPAASKGIQGIRREISERTVEVSAKQEWTDTGIDLERNALIEMTAEGRIKIGERSTGPDGIRSGNSTSRFPMPDKGLGAVIAKVRYRNGRDSALFFIGSNQQMNVETHQIGRLYFGINDDVLRDNSGSYRITVSVSPADSNFRQRQLREKTMDVLAAQAWIDTGVDLEPNAWIDITSENQIMIGERRAGADGIRSSNNTSRFPMPDKDLGAVIAKVRYRNGRDSAFFFIGSSQQTNIDTNQTGRLYIGINDDVLRDNSGFYRITIRW